MPSDRIEPLFDSGWLLAMTLGLLIVGIVGWAILFGVLL